MKFEKVTAGLFLVGVIALAGFQNCSSSRSSASASNSIIQSNGNGGVYEGKRYYQVLPNFTCEANPAPAAEAIIDVDKQTASVLINSTNQCVTEADATPVNWNYVELVMLQGFYSILEDRIFEKTDTPDLTSTTFWETFCETDPFSPVTDTQPRVQIMIEHDRFLKMSALFSDGQYHETNALPTATRLPTNYNYTSFDPAISIDVSLTTTTLGVHGFRKVGTIVWTSPNTGLQYTEPLQCVVVIP